MTPRCSNCPREIDPPPCRDCEHDQCLHFNFEEGGCDAFVPSVYAGQTDRCDCLGYDPAATLCQDCQRERDDLASYDERYGISGDDRRR